MSRDEHDKIVQRIIDEEVIELRHISIVFSSNINRVLRITRGSRHILDRLDNPKEELAYMHDATRSGIVFLHATLETTLREIVRVKLKTSNNISNFVIPLSGSSGIPKRKEKFTMVDLSKHKGKTVDEIIEVSIDEYLSTLSFNNSTDIANMLEKLEVRQNDTLKSYYPELSQMIDRRHKIVHEGDKIRGSKSYQLESIDVDELIKWIHIVHNFCIEVMTLIVGNIFVPKIMARLKKENIQANEYDIANAITVESKIIN